MDARWTQRWQQVDALFAAVLEYPPAARRPFLREACRGDADLYEAVRALLTSAEEAETVLGESVSQFLAPALPDLERRLVPAADDPPAGRRVGPYRILTEIGRGGMGTVYLAERADAQYRKRVALKLVRRGMDTEEILRRFRYERQILASLEHPNIARLLDGGLSDDGRPYLVMEHVDGASIDRYCDEKKLRIEARLHLFCDVCEAVQYAHRNLVVHRDLKPSNILVTEAGQVKLLDFGIAKLLGEEAADLSVPRTRTGVRVMTPEYASPEQVRGALITTASDVYALGVVLYELLTGHRPYSLHARGPYERERAVLEQEPERPSIAVTRSGPEAAPGSTVPTAEQVSAARSTTVDRLQRRLRGDLDTIVLMALRKEPERRYQSATQFLDDIRRHLTGRPVQARKDTLGYRAQKFVRRHRFGVAAAAAFLLLVVGFAVAMGFQQAETARERDRAALERDKAQQIVTLFTDLFKEADPLTARGDTLDVYVLLERARGRMTQALKDQPDVRAQMLHVLGNIYMNMAAYGRAEPLLEEALHLRRTLYGEQHVDAAGTLEALGTLHRERGDYDAAVRLHRQALSLRQALLGKEHPETAQALGHLALSLQRNGQYEEAEACYRKAIRTYRRSQGEAASRLGETISNLGTLRYEVGDFAGAEALFREALQLIRGHQGDTHPYVADVLSSLASTLQYRGEIQAAEPLHNEAFQIRLSIYGEAHPKVTLSLNNLATVYDELGAHSVADSLYRKAIRLDGSLLGDDHPDVAMTKHNLALMLHETGRYAEAAGLLREAVASLHETLPPDHLYTVIASASLGLALTDAGQLDEAEGLLRRSLTAMQQAFPEGHWRIAVVERNLGACLTAKGAFPEAEALLLRSYPVLQAERGPDANVTLVALRHLVALYQAWNKPEQTAQYQTLLAALDA